MRWCRSLVLLQTIPTSPNPALHKQHLRELAFMRECSDPHIVQYYGAFLEDVRLSPQPLRSLIVLTLTFLAQCYRMILRLESAWSSAKEEVSIQSTSESN